MTNYFLFSAVSFDDYLAEIGEPTGFRSSDSLAGSFSGFFLDYLRPVPDDLDGDPLQNLDAFEQIIRCMKENGIGYGSVNHPVDRDSVCGYTGIIGDRCPKCGRTEEQHTIMRERIKRIRPCC